MFSKLAPVVALSSIISVTKASAVAIRDDYCVNPTTVYLIPCEMSYPVVINNYFESNTIINIGGGTTINIDNAPTYINTVVTGVSTVYSTVTATTTTTATAVPTPAPIVFFNLAITPAVLKKRQTSGGAYVGDYGAAVQGCAAATAFYIQNGELLTTSGEIVSTSDGVSYSPFAASSVAQEITTVFTLGEAGNLEWTNELFPNLRASYCVLDDVLEAVFTAQIPDGCDLSILSAVPVSECGEATSTSTNSDGSLTTFTSETATTPTPESSAIVSTFPDGSVITVTNPGEVSTFTVGGTTITGDSTTVTIPEVTGTITEPAVTETTTATTTTSGAEATDAVSPDDSFVIIVNNPNTKAKRSLSYLVFNSNVATTTESQDDASRFSANTGRLYSELQNVGLSNADIAANTGAAPFKLFTGLPDVGKFFSVSGSGGFSFKPQSYDGQSLGFEIVFCILESTGVLYAKYISGEVLGCDEVSISIVVSDPGESQQPTTTSAVISPTPDPSSDPDTTSATLAPTPIKARSLAKKAPSNMQRRGGLFRSPRAPAKN